MGNRRAHRRPATLNPGAGSVVSGGHRRLGGYADAMRDTFCSSCGSRFTQAPGVYPRRCYACGDTAFRNPIPVAVALVPVPGGLLTVQRAIEPKRGEFALPGGFVDFGESWQAGCAREVFEETGVTIDPDSVTLVAAHSTPDGARVLIFGLCPPLPVMPTLLANSETQSLGVYSGFEAAGATSDGAPASKPAHLAFPLHTRVARGCLGLD